ncbi:PadR family transcriptional regulator [Halalkalibacter wakoensis]|nr:PadR family transcriptional regulator [Halalkalibacter wakoensis]
MSDPFINLKNSMKNTVFHNLTFSDARKKIVKEIIQAKNPQSQLDLWKDETLLAVLEATQLEAKHGFAISTQLFQKGDQSFHQNEGQLYTLLHLLENKQLLQSKWVDEKKYYSLTKKGKKLVIRYRQEPSKQRTLLKVLLQEASL